MALHKTSHSPWPAGGERHGIRMKHMKLRAGLLVLTALLFAGCAKQDTELLEFKTSVDAFCDKIVAFDADINKITNISADEAGLEAAKKELLDCLDGLEDEFRKFSNLDFPEEFDYLENMADEAGDYMTEAVKSYHNLYGRADGYNANMEEYANENYARAYKRIKVIVALLRGETPDEEGLTIQ